MEGYTIDGQPVNSAFYNATLHRVLRRVRHCIGERRLETPRLRIWVYEYSDGEIETVRVRRRRGDS